MSLGVLSIIYDNSEGCTQKYICQKIQYNKQSVNMIIKSFWEQGYVELAEMKKDRRNKQVKLSESGKIFAEKVIGLLWKVENDALENTTLEQREALMAFFEAYEQSFRSGVEALSDMMNKNEREGDVLWIERIGFDVLFVKVRLESRLGKDVYKRQGECQL